MKVTIDLENLESLVQNTMETNIENIVKEQIEGTVKRLLIILLRRLLKKRYLRIFSVLLMNT